MGDPNASQRSETTTLSVIWDQKPVDWLQLRARYGLFTNLVTFKDPFTAGDTQAGNFDFTDSKSKIYTERQEFELLAAVTFPKWNTLTVGGEYKYEYGRNESVGFAGPGVSSTFSQSLETWSLYAQDELRLFDRVILSGGVRYDDNNEFGDVTTYRAGAVVLVKETGTKLRGTWGQGFRAPTINDLFFPGFSNPDLQPEHSTSWEVGVDQALWKNRIRLGATYFNNAFDDLIQFVFAGGVFQPVNVGEAESQGVELTAAFDVLDQLSLTANYTYVNAQDLTAQHRAAAGAPQRPQLRHHLVTAAFALRLHPGQRRLQPVRGDGLSAQPRVLPHRRGRRVPDHPEAGDVPVARLPGPDQQRHRSAILRGPRLQGARHQRPRRIASAVLRATR